MRANLPRIKISELCELIVDCVNKTAPSLEYETPFKMIRTPNIKNGVVNLNGCRSVTQETYEKWTRRATVDEGDILLTREAPMGEVGLVNFQETVFLGQRIMQYRVNPSKLDSDFLLYAFLSSDLQYQFRRHDSSGSIVSHIKVPDCSEFEISLPTLVEQKKISKVLRNLDDKIVLNNKINDEIEAMVKLIYDYWFVQFDFLDANGNPYRSSGGKMIYNKELKREIPEGWGVDIINNVIEVKDGTHASPKPQKSGYRLITSKHLKPEGLDFERANFISEEEYESVNKRSKVDTGDILFSMIGSIGEIYKVDEEVIDFAIKNIALYKSSKKPEYINFIYTFLKSYDMQRYMGNVTGGSIQKFIGLGALRNMPIFTNDDMIMKFVKTTDHLFQKKTVIKLENQELTQLRDWLLPMLMNGQVTVRGA
jgi:type I restriction enzyme S subunit